MSLIEVRKIWDKGAHNAFTGLARFNGEWYCSFREGAQHRGRPDGSGNGLVRVLSSSDGQEWKSVALLSWDGGDLRDPQLTVTRDGLLMINGAVRFHPAPQDGPVRKSITWLSSDGENWNGPYHDESALDTWRWSVTWHGANAYCFGYSGKDQGGHLYRTDDGKNWVLVADNVFPVSEDGRGNEASLAFTPEGVGYTLLRRDPIAYDAGSAGNVPAAFAMLGTAMPPYKEWSWKNLGTRMGGPQLFRLADGRFAAVVRLYDGRRRTSVGWIDPEAGAWTECLELPSGGDTGYAGIVEHEGVLWISYYSSHEGKSAVYIAKVGIDETSSASSRTKPEYEVLTHPSPDELRAGFTEWAEQYPHAFRMEERGTTPGGRPILMGRITDYAEPDDDKQVAMLTSCHVAKELNAGTGLLRFMRWLISDDPAAAEIRRKQIVLVVPYTDPDGIAGGGTIIREGNMQGRYVPNVRREVYLCWGPDGVTNPGRHPEALVLQDIMDEYMPDIFIDFHGFSFSDQTMWESTGISWASALSRCYLHDVPRLIDEAAEEEGFLITKGEQDAGQILTTSNVPGASPWFYLRRPGANITLYPYLKFHSLAFIMEVGFEESLIVRTRRALQIGNERWRGERYPGYPVNQIGIWGSMAVSAWGTTALERRKSRCELWQKLPQLTFGMAAPEPRGAIVAHVATTPSAREKFLSTRNLEDMLKGCRDDPRFNSEAIADVISRIPATRTGWSKYDSDKGASTEIEPVKHGLVIRLLVPCNKAEITEIRLDGHLLKESGADGYNVRRNPGTIVEIAVPPDKVADFHVASCFYDSPAKRRSGFRPEDWQ